MSIHESLNQLIKTFSSSKKETDIEKYVEKDVEKVIKKRKGWFNGSIVVILNRNLEINETIVIPETENEDDLNSHLSELINKFKDNFIIPTNVKGGHLGLKDLEIFSGKIDEIESKKEDIKEKIERVMKKVGKNNSEISQKEIVEEKTNNILNKIREIIENEKKREKVIKRILVVSIPPQELVVIIDKKLEIKEDIIPQSKERYLLSSYSGYKKIFKGEVKKLNIEKIKREITKRVDEKIDRDYLDKKLTEIFKKIEEKIREKKDFENILILLEDTNIETDVYGICMICGSEEYLTPLTDLSKTLLWLVSENKNITFVYDHSKKYSTRNISICKNCTNTLKYECDKYIDLDNAFKFLGYNFKVFPQLTIDEKEKIKSVWDRINLDIKNKTFDEVIHNISYDTELRIISDLVWFNVLIYGKNEKNGNKIDVVHSLENIKLIDVIEVYNIFKEWKEKRKFKYCLICKNGLLEAILVKNKGSKGIEIHNKSLALQILNKLLRKEKIDKKTLETIMSLFNKISRKYIYDNNEEKIKEIINLINLIDFLNYYNQKLEKSLS
jgi:hypothetical protein